MLEFFGSLFWWFFLDDVDDDDDDVDDEVMMSDLQADGLLIFQMLWFRTQVHGSWPCWIFNERATLAVFVAASRRVDEMNASLMTNTEFSWAELAECFQVLCRSSSSVVRVKNRQDQTTGATWCRWLSQFANWVGRRQIQRRPKEPCLTSSAMSVLCVAPLNPCELLRSWNPLFVDRFAERFHGSSTSTMSTFRPQMFEKRTSDVLNCMFRDTLDTVYCIPGRLIFPVTAASATCSEKIDSWKTHVVSTWWYLVATWNWRRL